jgi:aminoglycoside phosphotransferase (APT) family kinase protein
MLVDSLLPRIADELGLIVVAPMRGGEFGATIVRDRDGQELVLKATSASRAPRIARGAGLAERLRQSGYPAPLFVATGVAHNASWSLQERLPGEVPPQVTMPQALRLIALTELHAGAGDEAAPWQTDAIPAMKAWARQVTSHQPSRVLAFELARIAMRSSDVTLRDQDVIHNDFSHRNFLAAGDQVTGIIDWELADVGDWRLDLVTLAYWAALSPARVPEGIARRVEAAMCEFVPRDVIGLFAAYQALRHLDYVARAHPRLVLLTTSAIERKIAPWWRHGLVGHRAVA